MEPTLAEIRMFAGNFAPRMWMFCEGQLLPISQWQALFSIIGTTYGGDGRTTFALPDLRGRSAVGAGQGPGLTDRRLGAKGGSEQNTMTISNLPSHTHTGSGKLNVSNGSAASNTPEGNVFAAAMGRDTTTGQQVQVNSYGTPANAPMAPNSVKVTVQNSGGNIPIQNIQPSLGMNYIIAVQGIFPSRG